MRSLRRITVKLRKLNRQLVALCNPRRSATERRRSPVAASSFVALVCLAWCSAAHAGCPPWRPCGPGNTWGGNQCIPQGFYGADFRPACACHDACLETCASRRDCDQQFLCNMYSACECSCNPKKCQHKARCYYRMARLAHMFQH